MKESADRSAPAAKINGFPVIAIAAGLREIASVIAALSSARDEGPNVFGRLWSCPLSKVIKARFPAPPNAPRLISRTNA